MKPSRWKLWASWLPNAQGLEERCSQLEWPGARFYDMLLGSPSSQARLANHLDEVIGQLCAELAARWEVDAELEALQTSAA
jgi:hypothetical protein